MSRMFMQRLAILVFVVLFVIGQTTTITLAYRNSSVIPSQNLASKNFWQLNQALAFYQKASQQYWPMIPSHPSVIKLGTKSHSVLILRERLLMTGDLSPYDDQGGSRYDYRLREAILSFQERHGLKADGAIGNDTRNELNVSPAVRMQQIALNMQRWAALSSKLKNDDRFIIVNIPDFHMHLYENHHRILSLRAIVGKPDLQTPEIASKITRIVFNPYWNIPNKIAKKDIAPKMLEDPGYLHRMHIRIFKTEDDDSGQITPGRVNWESAAESGLIYHLRQDPGPDNALGQVKFEFQNSHDVYMHDTSAKNLFETDIRDYSHGCIRLENPFALVNYLMKDSPNWSEERLQEILATGKTRYVKVPVPIPIFVTYITTWVDEEGRLNFRNDVYNLDQINSEDNQEIW